MSPERNQSIIEYGLWSADYSLCFFPFSWAVPSIWRRSQRRPMVTLAATSGSSAEMPPCIVSETSSGRSRWGRSLSSSKMARRRKRMTHIQTPTRSYRATHPLASLLHLPSMRGYSSVGKQITIILSKLDLFLRHKAAINHSSCAPSAMSSSIMSFSWTASCRQRIFYIRAAISHLAFSGFGCC